MRAEQSLIVLPRNQTFEVLQSGNVFGRLHWRLGTKRFPDRNWDDFIVVILGWWLSKVRMHLRDGAPRQLLFMDGPYFVVLSTASKTRCSLKGCKSGDDDEVLFEHHVGKRALVRSLVAAAETTVAKCRRAGIAGADVNKLETELRKLVATQARRPTVKSHGVGAR